MKKLYLYCSLLGIVLLFPVLSFLFVLTIGNLVVNPTQWARPIGIIAFVTFALIFYKDIKFKTSFKAIPAKSFPIIVFITIALYIVNGFIYNIGRDLTLVSKSNFQTSHLFYILIPTPFLEELCCRIIIINRFGKKINEWVLIFVTAIYFAAIHIGSIYLFINMFLLGAVLARLFVTTGSGTSLVVIHFLYSCIYVLMNSVFFNFTSKMLSLYYSPLHYIIFGTFLLSLLLIFIKLPSSIIGNLMTNRRD